MYMQNNAFQNAQQIGTGRGFSPVYYADVVNHCPACGHTHWHIGRSMAQCAFCDTALPLAIVAAQPDEPLIWFRGSSTA